MTINPKQLSAIIALSGSERYAHFIKRVADSQEVWGLYDQGWALAADDNGIPVFPLWPASEYAQLCAENEWTGYAPKSFDVDELMGELLPKLKQDGVLPGIFFTPTNKGVTPSHDEFRRDLDAELQKYM